MTRESSLWTALRSVLPAGCHAVRVENSVGLGTPDVSLCMPEVEHSPKAPECAECQDVFCAGCGYYIEPGMLSGWDGWIELKVQEKPKREKTTFRCEHFTDEQRTWLVDRCRSGGHAYMLLQVTGCDSGSRYLFIRGDIAAVWIGFCTFTELLTKAEWVGENLTELVGHLRG